MDIANLIHRLREKGLTQAEIAEAVPCSQSTISEMENGKIGTVRPSYRVVDGLLKLAERNGLRTSQREGSPRRRRTDKSG